jgi:cysteinyl-tRNA synthetase
VKKHFWKKAENPTMTLRIYNVLQREEMPFEPLAEGKVNMYVCGPTVYDHAHLGHAKTYVSFDIINRYLRASGYDVLYVQNLTDVGHLLDTGEDRILKKARQLAATPMQIVETYTRSYFEDMDALGVMRPDISPRASAHIPEQIKMIEALLAKGHAYVVDGTVYFDIRSWVGYGKLSSRRLDEQEAGSRESVREDKRHPDDFALWKKAEPEPILRWDSPWGEGFPGWHIECSAMARKYLGDTFDIHGGGIDNIFPHNECEIAQSEACNDADFARYWILVGSLMVPDESGNPVKMSKSLGNFYTIKDTLKMHPAQVIRTFIASGHYRKPITFSTDALGSARNGWERLRTAPNSEQGNQILGVLGETHQKFYAVMDDDFSAPVALATLYDLTREVNTLLYSHPVIGCSVLEAIDRTYRELGGDILGVVPEKTVNCNAERESDLIRLLIDIRARARQAKDFALSDQIRDYLAQRNIVLEAAGSQVTLWRVIG